MKACLAIFACLIWLFAGAAKPPTVAASAADELVQCCCCGPVQTCTCCCNPPSQKESEEQHSSSLSGCTCDDVPPATPHCVRIEISQLRKSSLETPAPVSAGIEESCKVMDIREVAHSPSPDLAHISTFIILI